MSGERVYRVAVAARRSVDRILRGLPDSPVAATFLGQAQGIAHALTITVPEAGSFERRYLEDLAARRIRDARSHAREMRASRSRSAEVAR